MVILDLGEAHKSDGIALYKFVEAGIILNHTKNGLKQNAKKKRGLHGLSIENHEVDKRSPFSPLASLQLPTTPQIKLK